MTTEIIMTESGKKIICENCGQESAARTIKLYDGFRPAGEKLVCAFCGAELSGRERTPSEDAALEDLKAGEPPPFCRRCRHYVVNPFIQKCTLDNREVKASDTCGRFSPRPERAREVPPPRKKDPLEGLFES